MSYLMTLAKYLGLTNETTKEIDKLKELSDDESDYEEEPPRKREGDTLEEEEVIHDIDYSEPTPIKKKIKDDSDEGYINSVLSIENLYPYIRSNIASITIDGTTFTTRGILFGKKHDTLDVFHHSYNKVCVVSVLPNGDKNFFWVYQSTSELGMWRLCGTIYDNPNMFDKLVHSDKIGDYVQTTLIHVRLQNYINQMLLIHKHESYFNLNVIMSSKPNPLRGLTRFREQKITNCSVFSGKMMEVVNPEIREIHASPFNMFKDDQQCGLDFPQEVLDAFSVEFKNTYEIYDSPEIIYENYTNINESNDSTTYSEVCKVEVVGDIKEIYLRKKIPSNRVGTPEYSVNKIKLIFLQTKSVNCYKKSIRSSLEKVLERTTSPEDVVSVVGLPLSNKTYFMPIALTPVIEGLPECNEYGVYTKYIRAGSYVCKLFDYHFQCRPNEKERMICLKQYYFIGDRYINLFPFRELSPVITSVDIANLPPPPPPSKIYNPPSPPEIPSSTSSSVKGGKKRKTKRKRIHKKNTRRIKPRCSRRR